MAEEEVKEAEVEKKEERSLKDFFQKLKYKFWYYAQPVVNISLFWKMGIVIGACVVVNFLMAGYLYYKLKKMYHHLQLSLGYKYELLAQEGLKQLKELERLSPKSKEFSLKLATVEYLVKSALLGGAYEEGAGEYVYRIKFPEESDIPPEIKQRLREVLNQIALLKKKSSGVEVSKVLREVETKFNEILIWGHRNYEGFIEKAYKFLQETSTLKWWIVFVVLLFVAWGAFAFFYMVIQPLKMVTERIRGIARGEFKGCIEGGDECVVSYYARDEIGDLVSAVNDLVSNYRDLNTFKHIIEEDEEMEEVFRRLSDVFKHKLELSNFVIFQVSNSQNTMQVICSSPEDIEVNSEILINANLCRAKRTGHKVTSIETEGICRHFLWPDEADHYCIPMMSGGTCVGVVQFLLPKGIETRRMKRIEERLRIAEEYIREAIPVIEAKRYAETLKEQSLKDPLTELYNRRFLETTIDNIVAGILRRNSIMGILMADLDYFKQINDRYGHDVGDKVLRQTAQILKNNVRQSDLVVRFGGEEFLILLLDVKEGESVRVAEKLRSLVETHKFEVPGGVIHRTISIGVSEFPVDAQGVWEAIKYADVALYKAKEMGRNRVVRFTPDMWPSEEY